MDGSCSSKNACVNERAQSPSGVRSERGGQGGKALDTFIGVLESGRQIGAYRSIVDEGPVVAELLGIARARVENVGNRLVLLEYVDRLLDRVSQRQQETVA
jgi:hypothetical protein